MQDWAIEYIRHVLKEKSWSATKLADASGVSSSTITRPLSQADWPHKVSRNTIQKVWQASGIDPEPFANSANELFFRGVLKSRIVETIDADGRKVNESNHSETASRILPNDDQIRIEIIGGRAEVRAVIGKEGIRKLVHKLSALEELLE